MKTAQAVAIQAVVATARVVARDRPLSDFTVSPNHTAKANFLSNFGEQNQPFESLNASKGFCFSRENPEPGGRGL
ncbi:MAG: hypothetical protein AAFY26_05770 [Cyanobacteria bacterium J06638_22]